MGTLFVVSTPIGNMEDMTFRAVRVLREVHLVAAEDTRSARKLFSRYGISTPLTSYFEGNEKEKAPGLVEKLKEGRDIALISEAGTPGISDPGYRLIRLAIENSIPVVPVPGPSALITALSVSGLPLDEFTFRGFVPTGKNRKREFFLEMLSTEHTFVMYESARRLDETLEIITEVLGDVYVVVAREMTKLHEEVLRGRALEIRRISGERPLRGELAIILRTELKAPTATDLAAGIAELLKSGLKLKEVVRALSREFGLPRGAVYKEALRIKEELGL